MNICVFCASSDRIDPFFFEAARELGRELALKGHTLVYGGGNVGLMGEIARTVHQHQGRVVGIIPKALVQREVAYRHADELIVSEDMLSRKKLLMERSDLFVSLPGGIGTLDEIFEVITHVQLDYHRKKSIFINLKGYYNPLSQFLQQLWDQGMIRQRLDELYTMVDDVPACMNLIEA